MKRVTSNKKPIDFYDYLLKKNYSEAEVIEWRAVPPGLYTNLPPKDKLQRFSIDMGRGVEEVLYAPTRIQRLFHGSTVPNCILEGPRGTGKSLAIRWDAHMRALYTPGFTYLVLRREMRDLRMSHLKFIDYEMRRLNPDHKNPFNKTDNIAYYGNGSVGFYSYCVHLADVMHLLSSDFGAIYFDEITTFPWEMISKIAASARVPEDSGLTAFVKGGTNPLGVGAHDVKIHFITKRVPNDPDYKPEQWEAIRTTRQDNPYLDWKQYDSRLSSLSDRVRKAWRDGEWVNEGAYFTEFAPTLDGQPWHVIDEMPRYRGNQSIVGQSWIRIYRSLDWGFRPDPAVCIWYAVFPSGLAIAFKEKHWLETVAADVAKDIKRESKDMHVIDTFADPSIFAKRGESLFSIGDIIENNGIPLTPSVNDRTRFGLAICDYLNSRVKDEVETEDGSRIIREYPKLQILKDGCPELIRTLPDIQADPSMPSRIADGGEDHWVVSLAYFCMGDSPPPRDPARPVTPRWMLSKKAFNRSFTVGL